MFILEAQSSFVKKVLGNIYGADYMKTINQHKILRKSSHILHVNAIYMAILNSNSTAMFEFYCNDFRRVIIPQQVLISRYFVRPFSVVIIYFRESIYFLINNDLCNFFSLVYYDLESYHNGEVSIHHYTSTVYVNKFLLIGLPNFPQTSIF